jgi:hypothetical protein
VHPLRARRQTLSRRGAIVPSGRYGGNLDGGDGGARLPINVTRVGNVGGVGLIKLCLRGCVSKVIKKSGECLIKAVRGRHQGNMIKVIKVIKYARLDLIMFL